MKKFKDEKEKRNYKDDRDKTANVNVIFLWNLEEKEEEA